MGFQSCGANEAIVVSAGCCHSRQRIVCDGRIFVYPGQKYEKLSLNTHTLKVECRDVITCKGIPITAVAIGQVRVDRGSKRSLEVASEILLGKAIIQRRMMITDIFQKHQKSVMESMTVEEIYSDRRRFCTAVFERSAAEFASMGLICVSFTLKDVFDNVGYLKGLGEAYRAEREAALRQQAQNEK